MITNETIIKAAKAAGLADMKPVAYLRWEDGVPLWSEDCVCKDDVYTNNGDDDSFGMPIYSADQVSALIQRNAELEAKAKELEDECVRWLSLLPNPNKTPTRHFEKLPELFTPDEIGKAMRHVPEAT